MKIEDQTLQLRLFSTSRIRITFDRVFGDITVDSIHHVVDGEPRRFFEPDQVLPVKTQRRLQLGATAQC